MDMNNGWIETPVDPEQLPFQVLAEKPMLWFIVHPAFDEWPERRFTFAGSLVRRGNEYLLQNKQAEETALYYHSAIAYQECPKDPAVVF
jgi:hypothetical protein